MAYGLASLCLGTREANTAPDHYLLLRDFVTATGDPLEEGPLSTTDKLDSKRPPPPAKPADFMECVANLSNIMTKVYGERWSTFFTFLGDYLMDLHRTEVWKYPMGMMIRWFDQVLFQLCESVYEAKREVCHLLEDNSPNTDQVKEVVTTPIPIGADPHGLMRYKERIVLDYNVLNPLDHAGYFQVFCIGRADRRREREFYRLTDQAASSRKTGEGDTRKTGKRKGKGKGKDDRPGGRGHGGKGDQRSHPPAPGPFSAPPPGDDDEDKAGAAKKKRANRAVRRKAKRVSARTPGSKAATKPRIKAKAKTKRRPRSASRSRKAGETPPESGEANQRAPSVSRRLYPLGEQLPGAMFNIAKSRTPLDQKSGRKKCWAFSCHSGCPYSAAECKYGAHVAIYFGPHTDPCLRAALKRWGDLKTGAQLSDAPAVDRAVKELLTKVRADQAQARAEGGTRDVPPSAPTKEGGRSCGTHR